jgi:hypothetical protein
VTRAPLGGSDGAERLDETLRTWALQWDASATLLGIEHQRVADDRGHFHWLVRLKGDERDVITLWFSLRQRTVHVETEVMPAPEENREALYRFMLVKNAELRELHLAIGPEDGIYLMSEVPIGEVTVERLDELVGAAVTYVDEIFPTAMTMGLPALYRRRRRP